MNITKQLFASILSSTLISSTAIAGYDGALSKADAEALLSGNTYQGKHSVRGWDVDLYINPNGSVTEKRGKNIYPGKWHMDDEGRFCWVLDKWSNKLWCRWIVKTGENEYIKVKDDGKEVRRFSMVIGNAIAPIANKELSAEETKKLFTDKKFDGKNHDTGKESSNKAKANGKMYADVLMGPTWDIKWWVDESGQHCLDHPKFGKSCGKIIDNGDGSYARMVDGIKANTYKRFR